MEKVPKRCSRFSDEIISKRIAEGYGSGILADYKPWLQVGDFSSAGRGNRVLNPYTGRLHHFFADLEKDYYYLLLWSENVVDIREQFPLLPRSETEHIADALGYKHPKTPGGKTNTVMTTDFLLTIQGAEGTRNEARYVKYKQGFNNIRTCEKFAIERNYWMEKGIGLKVVTEDSINRIKARNIERIMSYYNYFQNESDAELAEKCIEMQMLMKENKYMNISEIARLFERSNNLEPNTGMSYFYYFGSHKMIPLDMNSKIVGTTPVFEAVVYEQIDALLQREVDYIENNNAKRSV